MTTKETIKEALHRILGEIGADEAKALARYFKLQVAPAQLPDALHRAIDALSDDEADDALDFLNLQADPGELSEEELKDLRRADREFERGEYVTREELVEKYNF